MFATEERESVTLTNEGQKIFAILHKPLNSTKSPAILICPGFGGTKCGKHRLFVRLAQDLAKMGIASLRFDYRGAGDSEGEFEDITVESKVSDTLLCLDFLSSDPSIDPNRIGLLGRSLGGAISVLAATRFKKIKSLVLWAPVFSSEPWRKMWESYKLNPSAFSSKDVLVSLPSMPNLPFLEQFFQLDIAKELVTLAHIPLLHIQGDKDMVVKAEHSEAYKQVRKINDNTRFLQLPNSDHDFTDSKDKSIAVAETCQWYQQTL